MPKAKPLIRGRKKVSELDPISQEWLDSIPNRTEKNRFRYHFNRLKRTMFVDLKKDIHISERFRLIIKTLAKEMPSFNILNGGRSFKASTIYQKLWTYHNTLCTTWQEDSPQRFQRSRNSSISKKSTISSN